MPRLTYDSFEPGAVTTYGSYPVTREEIIAFASQYDPQPMHLDEAAAAGTLLGGIGSSGWHTCSMLMRMLYDNVLADSTGMGAGGIDEVKWKRPVRPGDMLSIRQTVLDKRPSSRGDRGYVRFRFEVLNQSGDVVLEQTNSIIFGVSRPEAA